ATLDFSVAPAYYQTAWFRVTCLAFFLAALATIYRLRLREVTRQVRMRMEARLEERERIARDLHDTLLQSVQGLIFKLDAIAKTARSVEQAREAIVETLDRADQVLAEARDRVGSLRGRVPLPDLPSAFQQAAEEASPDSSAVVRVIVEGRERALDP